MVGIEVGVTVSTVVVAITVIINVLFSSVDKLAIYFPGNVNAYSWPTSALKRLGVSSGAQGAGSNFLCSPSSNNTQDPCETVRSVVVVFGLHCTTTFSAVEQYSVVGVEVCVVVRLVDCVGTAEVLSQAKVNGL